jgi:hypothetical protein
MGLDWNPLARPKTGFEAEFERLLAVDLDRLNDQERQAHLARIHEISEAPFETLGAPRVGFDREADDWLRERLRERGQENRFPHTVDEMRGYYVLDLLPESPGLPIYGSMGYEGVDRYTFRGQFLDDAKQVIGDELYHRAWERITAARLHAYGEALLAAARRFAQQHGLEALEDGREPPSEDEESPEWRVHIVFSAAAWCLWWSARGHGLEPYW